MMGPVYPALLFIRDHNMKTGALPNGGGRTDVTVMVIHDPLSDREPQSRAFILCLRMKPFEQIKDDLEVFFLHANPVVTNIDL